MDSNSNNISKTVLVVEDDAGLLKLILKSLKNAGYNVLGADYGEKAIEIIKTNDDLLLLLDQQLPDISGKELITKINDAGIKVPFIVMTGLGNEKIAVEMMKLGASDYLVKDFGFIDILPDIIERTFKNVYIEKRLKEAEKELAEEAIRKRILIEQSRDGIVILDNDGKVYESNIRFAEMLGYTLDEVKNLSVFDWEFLHPPEVTLDMVKTVDEKGDFFESKHKRKDGSIYDVEISTNATLIEGQKLIFCVCRDITDRKKAEEALKERERTWATLISNLPGFVYRCALDRNWTMKYISKGCKDITGYHSDDFIDNKSLTFNDIIPLEYQETLWNIWQRVVKNKEIFFEEYPIIHKNGDIRWVWERGQAIYADNGDILYLEGFITEITDRIKSEEAIKEYEHLLSESQKIGHIGSWRLDMKTNELIWSEEVYRIFGVTPFSFKPTIENFLELVHPEDKGNVNDTYLNSIKKSQDFYEIEHRIVRKENNEVRYVIQKCKQESDSSGQKIKSIGMIQDITERKQAEFTLQKKNKELEAQYQEYSKLNELLRKTNYNLEIAKDKAEESDKLKTAFLQNLSHEIRTPLNGILGFTKMIADFDLPKEEVIEYSALIKQSGDRLLEMINNVLDMAKIETKQIVVTEKSFSINALINDIYRNYLPIANVYKIDLKYKTYLENEHSLVISDEPKIYQIISHLINNALKFTKSGSVEFGYEIVENDIQFYVKDTGVGIPVELSEKIFKLFTQVQDSISRSYEGAGLGLAICKGLVELLNGKIWLESKVNKGTSFYFTIPYIYKSSKEVYSKITTDILPSKKKTILVVEDDYMSFRYYSFVFKPDKYNLINAVNGAKAVEIVNTNPEIDLILMDIRMPVMDGIEATKQIKKIKPNIPIIAQTTYIYSDEKDKILAAGCDDYLTKPIEIDTLKIIIEKYLS